MSELRKEGATEAAYPPPVDQLLALGPSRFHEPWPDYLELGLGPEHIPELIRMAQDQALHGAGSDAAEVWAPLHAWRALGQLCAEDAIEPLIALREELEDDDSAISELPIVFGMIGPAALPALTRLLADSSRDVYIRITASAGIKEIAARHPEGREDCVGALAGQLSTESDPELNGFIVSYLLELKAIEAAPTIEQAFGQERVDEAIPGDWEDAQVALGLLEARITPRRSFLDEDEVIPPPPPSPHAGRRTAKAKAKTRARKKLAKQSRKQNRRRK